MQYDNFDPSETLRVDFNMNYCTYSTLRLSYWSNDIFPANLAFRVSFYIDGDEDMAYFLPVNHSGGTEVSNYDIAIPFDYMNTGTKFSLCLQSTSGNQYAEVYVSHVELRK